MKKLFIISSIVFAFVSCSKDSLSPSDIPAGYTDAAAVIGDYQDNFVKTFGTPSPNQTWGFGNSANIANAMRRANAVIDGDPFTYETTDGYYMTEIPATAKSPSEVADWQLPNLTELKLENGTFSLPLDRGSRDMYVNGNVTLNVDETHWISQARIYVLPNSTLTLTMSDVAYINNLEIYVAANGTLNYNYDKLYNQSGGGKIYSRGTINFLANEFQANNDAVVYNEGIVNGKSIKLAPNQSRPSFFYNFGELNLTGNLILFSESNFLNENTVTVGGSTELTGSVSATNELWWINKGHFETKNMVMHATNNKIYNLCQLLIEEHFYLHEGEYNLMPNSYTEAATAQLDMFYINMNGDAGINIKGAVNIASKYNDTFNQGFKYKAGSDNYVLIGGKCSVNLQKGTLNVDEGITYSIKEIEILNGTVAMTEEEVETAYPTEFPVTILNAESGVEFGKLTVTPKTTGCGATWTIGTLPITLPSLHVMAEDLSATEASDFDFNDVVIDVFYKNSTTVTIKLLAAGGTLPLRICENDNWEIHKLFNVPTTCMVNTGTKYHVAQLPYSQVEGLSVEAFDYVLNEGTWSTNQDEFAAQVNQRIKLEVQKGGAWYELLAEQGKPACKIATPVAVIDINWYPTEYKWPWEKQNIGVDFKNWVEDPTVKWYTTRKPLEETNAGE